MYISISQPVCHERSPGVSRKISEKYLSRDVLISLFTREICKIRSKDRFYLERIDFGKDIDKREREFR